MNSLEIITVVLLSVGSIQGFVYAAILFRGSKLNNAANRFLAAILIFFSYRLAVEAFNFFGIGIYDFWYHILLEYNWIYGALIYFFVKSYTLPNFKLELKKDWVHFIPVIIEFAWSNFIKTQNFYWDGTKESLSWLGYWGYVIWMHYPTMYIVSVVLVLLYSFKSHKLLIEKSNKKELYQNRILWVRNFLLILMFYSAIVLLIILLDFFFFDYAFNRIYNYPMYIGLAIITYGLGIIGFQKRNIPVIKENLLVSSEELESLQDLAKRVSELMTVEKIFLEPELTLNHLEKKLNASKNSISRAINLVFQKNFNDYINSHRIEELKKIINKPANKKYTLLSLAFEVGFNSKASFNRAVKKITGKPPSDLKKI